MKTYWTITISFILGMFMMATIAAFYKPVPEIIYNSNERIQSCEENGGRYSIWYNQYREEYDERCRIIDDEITDF